MWPSGGGGTEEIKLMSGNGKSGALALCAGADMMGSEGLTPAKSDAGRTPLTGPPVLGNRTPAGKLDGGRLLEGNGKSGMPRGSTDGGGRLTSAFSAKLARASP